ncbi:MAG: hypothetical protein WC768_04000 [Patescibacteria group bacterium]|jgi:hypothetical protein
MFFRRQNPILANYYSRNKFIRINFFLSLLFNLSIWLWIFSQAGSFTESLALHYNIYFGIDLLAAWYQIFFLPGLGLAFIFINFLLAGLVYQKEIILSQLLAAVTTFIQVILGIAVFLIILANF